VKPADLRRKLSEASGVITVSDFNLKHLRETYGDAATGVVRIFNGLDLDVYPYRPPQRRTLSVIAVGRLVEKKGFDDLVSACACLADRRDDFRCTIIGEGDCEAALRRQIAELNLEGVVDLAGPRPQPEVIAAVQSSAVFAAPCVVGNDGNRDGMPTVLLESMALGTPCVATPVTGIPEVVHHNKTGLIVPERQPQQLADVLSHLLDNPSERVRLATQARELIEAEFDVRRNAARLRDTFAGVHHNSKARPRLHEEVEVLQGVS
jgi:glycosyltransferase involved in cell wall biosynthesis